MTKIQGGRTSLALAVALGATLGVGCSSDDNDLDPGGSTVSGNVSSATTPGDTTLGNIVVEVRGDGQSSTTTDSAGNFTVLDAPTGEIELVLRRGACEAVFPIDSVSSRGNLDFVDIVFDCGGLDFLLVLESFEAILREDADSRIEPVRACVRVGDDDRTREIDAETATIIDDDDDIGSIGNLDENDRVGIEGDRNGSGRAATFIASEVRVLETDARDPCDDVL